MWEVGQSKEQTHWHCCFFSAVLFAVFFFFLLINGPNVQMSSAHMSTSGSDLCWPTIVVLWFILGMICHSARGLHLALWFMCTSNGEEDGDGFVKLVLCVIANSWPLWFSVFLATDTELFRSQADGRVLCGGYCRSCPVIRRFSSKWILAKIGFLETLWWRNRSSGNSALAWKCYDWGQLHYLIEEGVL